MCRRRPARTAPSPHLCGMLRPRRAPVLPVPCPPGPPSAALYAAPALPPGMGGGTARGPRPAGPARSQGDRCRRPPCPVGGAVGPGLRGHGVVRAGDRPGARALAWARDGGGDGRRAGGGGSGRVRGSAGRACGPVAALPLHCPSAGGSRAQGTPAQPDRGVHRRCRCRTCAGLARGRGRRRAHHRFDPRRGDPGAERSGSTCGRCGRAQREPPVHGVRTKVLPGASRGRKVRVCRGSWGVPGVRVDNQHLTSAAGGVTVQVWHPSGSVVAPETKLAGTPTSRSGKPRPGAGETAHVRRLFVDRSRCALEVSPAPRRVPMSLTAGRRAVVANKSGDPLSRRMWGRRPGRPGGWHTDPWRPSGTAASAALPEFPVTSRLQERPVPQSCSACRRRATHTLPRCGSHVQRPTWGA